MKRVITCVKNAILNHKNNTFRRQSVENVVEKLQMAVGATAETLDKSVDESPKRVTIVCKQHFSDQKVQSEGAGESRDGAQMKMSEVKLYGLTKSCDKVSHAFQSCALCSRQAVGSGGSVLGLKSIKVLRQMMDGAAGVPSSARCVDILSDATSSQKTPLRFPSILSKFK